MIKGVNKRIIEINDTNSIYFEKAVFYLRPGVKELPCEVSSREAYEYIEKLGLDTLPEVKPSKNYSSILFTIIAVISAAAIIWVFTH